MRNDYTRYEAVALAMVENDPGVAGSLYEDFPPSESLLRIEGFFPRLYAVYDLRFPFRAESVPLARRAAWNPDSPLFTSLSEKQAEPLEAVFGYQPRLSD